ncbi:MAG: SMC-Scp complex subunit ScpB, partial [bacterium]|nr:SMC-Scp complex subunit ScpB [bacterium]
MDTEIMIEEEILPQGVIPAEAVEVFADEDEDDGLSVELLRKISALVFASGKPLSTDRLAEILSLDDEVTEACLKQLQAELAASIYGFVLDEVAGGWQIRTRNELALTLRRLIPPKGRKLSKAAAETLAVIAYQQPVGRAEIEAIRGVDALPTLKTLLDAKLIRSVGRQEAPGTPALYGTTTKFLEKFALKDLAELPEVREIEELELDPGEVSE